MRLLCVHVLGKHPLWLLLCKSALSSSAPLLPVFYNQTYLCTSYSHTHTHAHTYTCTHNVTFLLQVRFAFVNFFCRLRDESLLSTTFAAWRSAVKQAKVGAERLEAAREELSAAKGRL